MTRDITFENWVRSVTPPCKHFGVDKIDVSEFEVKLKLAISEKLSNLTSFKEKLNYVAMQFAEQPASLMPEFLDTWSGIITKELTELGGNSKEVKMAILNMSCEKLIGLSKRISLEDFYDFTNLIHVLWDMDI